MEAVQTLFDFTTGSRTATNANLSKFKG